MSWCQVSHVEPEACNSCFGIGSEAGRDVNQAINHRVRFGEVPLAFASTVG